jgi:histone chaperone ASF1
MSVVSLLGVKVLNNPAAFSDSYEFEITFECLEQLQKGKHCRLFFSITLANFVCVCAL